MNAKITRRQALLATAGVAAGTLVAAQDKKPADKSWVGRTVLPRSHRVPTFLIAGNPDPAQAAGFLGDASYTVKAENETQVLVFEGLSRLWVQKDGVVPQADAVAHFDAQIKVNPMDAFAHNYRAWALKLLGKKEDAIKGFGDHLKLSPESSFGRSNRGLTYAELGKYDEAFADLAAAVKAGGVGWITAVANTGFVHELRGDFGKAVAEYRKAGELGSVLALNNLAWVLATCPDAKLRNGAEAVKVAKAICDATENMEGMYLDTLAAAHAEAGAFDDAVKAQELAHKDKSYDTAYGDEGRARLKLYKQKKPFRTDPPKT
jgi:tetratricopeptide (TPR) repeat protein